MRELRSPWLLDQWPRMLELMEHLILPRPRLSAHALGFLLMLQSRDNARITRMARQVVSSGGPLEEVYGYSRAVRVGVQVHVAGTAARGEALTGDAYVQAQNILDTIRTALERAGARVDDVVRTVMYVTDIGDAELVGRAHREVFGEVRPARPDVRLR
jgi:enamine deaminase RidA (YjgF/YER057c/UK114 family)